MNRLIHRILAALAGALLVLTLAGCGAKEARAATGPPRRICSVTLAGDEMLAHLVPPDRVVAVTRFVDDVRLSNVLAHYPPGVARIRDASLETVVRLEPDLVLLSPHNDADFLTLAHAAGLSTLTLDLHQSFADIQLAYNTLGLAVGEPERAASVIAWMEIGLADLSAALADIEQRPRVLFWAGGFTAGPQTTVGELIERAGGRNVAAELGIERSAEVDTERVVAAAPEYILLSRWDVTEEAGYTDLPPAFQELEALQAGRIVAIDGRLLDTLSAHVVEGAWQLARHLHPECISDQALARIAEGPARR